MHSPFRGPCRFLMQATSCSLSRAATHVLTIVQVYIFLSSLVALSQLHCSGLSMPYLLTKAMRSDNGLLSPYDTTCRRTEGREKERALTKQLVVIAFSCGPKSIQGLLHCICHFLLGPFSAQPSLHTLFYVSSIGYVRINI